MALESLDRSPPPFFRVGFAPLTKLIFFGALSVVLMFGDKQLQFTKPIRAGLDKAPDEVAAMFDDVAQRYDVTNTVLSMGQDRLWRKAVLAAVDPRAGEHVLDLAAGTGASTQSLAATGADVIACDFSLGMLRAGRAARPELNFVAGDATQLPFADHSFDAVTISFGLRNIVDPDAGLREMLRVCKPGGWCGEGAVGGRPKGAVVV